MMQPNTNHNVIPTSTQHNYDLNNKKRVLGTSIIEEQHNTRD